jgi:hypothetical protein
MARARRSWTSAIIREPLTRVGTHSERRTELDVPRDAKPVELRLGGCDAASARGSQVGQRAELLQGQRLADGLVVTVDRAEQAVGEQERIPEALVAGDRLTGRDYKVYLIAPELFGVINGRGQNPHADAGRLDGQPRPQRFNQND